MNCNLYKVIFSKRISAWVVVGETTKQGGKRASGGNASVLSGHMGKLRLLVLSTLLALGGGPAWSLEAGTLPGSASVAHGSVHHSVAANTMTVTQTTAKAVVNYQSFNIGRTATVNHSGGTMLARVTGTDSTQIDGRLNTSGMVLVNPHGVAIGKTGHVHAGSFTASTFDIKDEDFLRGEYRFERGTSQARVVNAGKIEVTQGGGYVALIGASVDNHGRIQTQGAPVVMAAGQSANIRVPLTGKVSLELDAADLNVSVTNHQQGVIVTEGGQVMMRAAAVVDAVSGRAPVLVKQAGLVDTTGQRGGRVEVLADKGTVRVSGVVKANSTDRSAGGDIYIGRDVKTNVLAAVGDASGAQLESQGGFVETSGDLLVTTGTRVKAKEWLLDPYNIEIVASGATTAGATALPDYTPNATSTILNTDIVAALDANTNVTISTAGAGTAPGNITVNADIVKSSIGTASLTLSADNHITVNNKIAAEGLAAGLNVNLMAGIDPGTGLISIAGGGIDARAGNVILRTQGDSISTTAGVTIKGVNISMNNTGGSIDSTTGVNNLDGAPSINQIVNGISIGGDLIATGNINLLGNIKDPGVGVNILNTATLTASGLDINLASNQNVVQAGVINASADGMSIALSARDILSTGAISTAIGGSLTATAADGNVVINNGAIRGAIVAQATGSIPYANNITISNVNSTAFGSISAVSTGAGNINIVNTGTSQLDFSARTDFGSVELNSSGAKLIITTVNGLSGVTAGGGTYITLTGDSVVLRDPITALDNGIVNITALTGSITREAASLITGLEVRLTAEGTIGSDGNTIGQALETIQTEAEILELTSKGAQYVHELSNVILTSSTENSDVLITALGNIIVSQSGITNLYGISTGSGNITLVAGDGRLAGDGLGGSIQSTVGGSPWLSTTGTVRLFTGNPRDTSPLSDLLPSFAELYLSPIGGALVNAQTNIAYQPFVSITGGAQAQVFFREVLTLDPSIQIQGLSKVYGELSAGDMIEGLLSDVNANNVIIHNTDSAGIFKLSAADFFNQVSAQIVNAAYSTGGYLNANENAYVLSFTPLAGSGIDPTGLGSGLYVQRKFLSAGFEAQDKIFDGDTLAVVQPSATGNQLPGDMLDISHTTANFADAEIGNNKNVSITGILVSGADANNYFHGNTTAIAMAAILPIQDPPPFDPPPFDPPTFDPPTFDPPTFAPPPDKSGAPEPEKPIPSARPNLPMLNRAIEQVELKPAEEDRNTCGRSSSYSCQCDATEYVLSNSMQRFEECQPRNITKRISVTWN